MYEWADPQACLQQRHCCCGRPLGSVLGPRELAMFPCRFAVPLLASRPEPPSLVGMPLFTVSWIPPCMPPPTQTSYGLGLGFRIQRTDRCEIGQQQQVVGNKTQLLQAGSAPEPIKGTKFIEA